MAQEITVRISEKTRNAMIGKVVVLLVAGVIAGYFYDQSVTINNERATQLTMEEYTAGYEDYKASLREEDWPLVGHVAVMLLVVGIFFGVYELIGWAVGRVVGRLFGKSIVSPESPRGPPTDGAAV